VTGPGTMIDAPHTGTAISEQPITAVPGLVGYTRP
jgi:hypothetical protein